MIKTYNMNKSVIKRCRWIENSKDETYIKYHDEQWGVPCHDEYTLIEMLILESFHAGLSWLIILKKRENFKRAFDDYDLEKIADYSEDKTAQLLKRQVDSPQQAEDCGYYK